MEAVVLFAGVAAFYALMCAGEEIAKWLMARFDRIADWFTEPDETDAERVDRIRNGGA